MDQMLLTPGENETGENGGWRGGRASRRPAIEAETAKQRWKYSGGSNKEGPSSRFGERDHDLEAEREGGIYEAVTREGQRVSLITVDQPRAARRKSTLNEEQGVFVGGVT